MSGEYNGVTSWLKRNLLGHIHVWCNAHVLNLVMTETSECCIPAINLFGFLNEIGVFFRDSYLRLDVWKNIPEGEKGMTSLKKLSTIGATRWWSKDKVLRTVFGEHDDFDKSLYVQAIMALYIDTIYRSSKFPSKHRHEASCLLEQLLKIRNDSNSSNIHHHL